MDFTLSEALAIASIMVDLVETLWVLMGLGTITRIGFDLWKIRLGK